jgi:arginyl-tRNA--protein-N-Asp/Glu arginylyltransferase
MSMMLRAIIWAKENNKKYVYLGSVKDEKAKYKLQFAGLEWFDGERWNDDLDELKNILQSEI